MAIPKNITKEHLLSAILKIDTEGIPTDGDSQYYDVIYNGKKYPPKLIVSFANLFANGEILDRKSFDGGVNTECFKLLETNGFAISKKDDEKKISIFEEIKRFLAQAVTKNQKTLHYIKNYQGLSVKVSFGIGNNSRIPWFAFLGEGQTVQNGIYPVYLFYKKQNLLILAYGVSEKNIPVAKWNLSHPKSVKDYFKENGLGRPTRYGTSFVCKDYITELPLDENEIDEDLNNIIAIYKKTLLNDQSQKLSSNQFPPPIKGQTLTMNFDHNIFASMAKKSGLSINANVSLRFIGSLLTKPFVILTGLSGSGKTKLAQAFAMWICEKETQYGIIPVGADWTNREPLLGFPNALKENEYVKPDNNALDLIIEANKNLDKPYFLILDEMNLSHVERYFADFLSVMESKSKISLHSGEEDWNGVPSEIKFPKNLFIIGTVNIDETTYMFSPKVLDRANVIEFRVTGEEMESYLKNNSLVNLENLEGLGASMAGSFVEIAKDNNHTAMDTTELNKSLMNFFSELKKTGAEFGYRSASEILRFATIINKIERAWSMSDIIDAAIMQKLLPKVHGSRRKLEPILKTLGTLCLTNGERFEDLLIPKTEIDFTDAAKIKYPISLEKILRMFDNLISNGFTSYAEA